MCERASPLRRAVLTRKDVAELSKLLRARIAFALTSLPAGSAFFLVIGGLSLLLAPVLRVGPGSSRQCIALTCLGQFVRVDVALVPAQDDLQCDVLEHDPIRLNRRDQ